MLSSNCKGKYPLQSGCSRISYLVLTDTAYSVGRQDRHFYFRSFLLSRKASNAINKLPKDISNAIIPIKTEMISNAVIYATSLPMYFGYADIINTGGYHPVMGTFRADIVSLLIPIINIFSNINPKKFLYLSLYNIPLQLLTMMTRNTLLQKYKLGQ